MSVYGNINAQLTTMSEAAIMESFINEAMDPVDELNSIVYNEYLNYSKMLESCVDESERAILEAKTEVLYEVTISDFINKIRELWTKFKNWVKDLFKKIFDRKKVVNVKTSTLLAKMKGLVNRAKTKGVTESSVLYEDTNGKPSKKVLRIYYDGKNFKKSELGELDRIGIDKVIDEICSNCLEFGNS